MSKLVKKLTKSTNLVIKKGPQTIKKSLKITGGVISAYLIADTLKRIGGEGFTEQLAEPSNIIFDKLEYINLLVRENVFYNNGQSIKYGRPVATKLLDDGLGSIGWIGGIYYIHKIFNNIKSKLNSN